MDTINTFSPELDGPTNSRVLTRRKTQGISKYRAYRLKQNATLKDLQRQTIELSRDLEFAKERKLIADATRTPDFFLWRDLAKRLREECKFAGAKQEQLKRMVQRQAMYIGTLHDLINRPS
ncbi:hypothetical protein P3T76_014951 [Phytophthora citrophthora]|uniref:Uncharacterized protein n=1 Tax=Phytophthora citrophthora TaxID=4793 RepID=A0AAD9G0C4_9STRA|nr:hypothetical protein P3T76_014951 [Phytophthora citrophthora]